MAVRSRFAEDELARAVRRGCRNPYSDLSVFEVDHPATQAWKRRMLEEASIQTLASLTFAPIDSERQTLSDGLAQAGFDDNRTTFFSWLGVTMYLTAEAIAATLELIAATPKGGGVVFDYAVVRSSLGVLNRLALDALSRRVAAAGEPFLSYLDPATLRTQLTSRGFDDIVDLNAGELNARYFRGRTDGLEIKGDIGRLLSAQL
jgi:methyltransferase (TIGR00027 family)